jgi:hypothetical protein
MVSAVAYVGLVALASQKLEVKLVDLEPVTAFGETILNKTPFSIGGIVVQNGIGCMAKPNVNKPKATFIYAISDKVAGLKGVFGVQDGVDSSGEEGIFSVYVDGDLVKEFRAEGNQKPVKVDLTFSKASSLKLVFEGGGAFANGTLSNIAKVDKPKVAEPPKQDNPGKTEPPKPSGNQVRVIVNAPIGGETFKDKVAFKWDKVDGAVAYGVEIIMIRNNDANVLPTRLLRAFTAKSESFEWNFSDDVVSGEYQVSVIAFSKKGVITMFSLPKRFFVARK